MPRYNDDQKDMVKRLVESMSDESQLSILYSVLLPAESTVKKWSEGEKEKENFFQRAWRLIRDDPYKIGWFAVELLTVLFIGVISFLCFTICVVLLGEVNPGIITTSNTLSELTASPVKYIPWAGLSMCLLGAVFAYVYARKERKQSWPKNVALVLLIASLALMVGYVIWGFILVLSDTHPALLFIVSAFFITVTCAYVYFAGSWMTPASHDGYKSLMNLITILALVITITIAAFTLLNGETFPDKIGFLQSVLGL